MVIAVDARAVFAERRRGTGKNLVDLYAEMAALRPTWRFVMIHQLPAADNPFAGCSNVERRQVDIKGDRLNLWQDVRLPMAARAVGAHVLHAPANTAPLVPLTRLVVTIHDLIPLELEPAAPGTTRWVRRVRRGAMRAHRVVTPSAYTKQLLVERLGVPTGKIVVNPWAPDRKCTRVGSEERVAEARRKYGVPDASNYVFGFAAEDPRKNTDGILRAWAEMGPERRRQHVLLLVGLQPVALRHFRDVARRLGVGESCILHGFADEADIAPLLSGAAVLCYPSRSEGFGLPILDAFACETCVITSSVSSLPEVAGEAAILVNPDSPAEISAALAKVISSPPMRETLVAAGRRRLRDFSWTRTAAVAADALEAAASGVPFEEPLSGGR